MDAELIKLIASLGGAGVVGGLSLWMWAQFRREHRADMKELREELRDGLGNLPDHLTAIHSRLGGLGADSIAPPPRGSRRGDKLKRLQTAPTGWPVKPTDEGE